jgi:hypothetical protein
MTGDSRVDGKGFGVERYGGLVVPGIALPYCTGVTD